MRIAVIILALASMAPAAPRQARVEGPKVFIAGWNSAGAVRAAYACTGFGSGPVVDVHVEGGLGSRIRDLAVTPAGPGDASFSFTLEYDTGIANLGPVHIFVTSGTGKSGDPFERFAVDVRRSR